MKNNLKKLKIIYSCNDKMYDALYLSILSIVKRTHSPIDFYLCSANLKQIKNKYKSLSQKHKKCIISMIKRHSPNSTFQILDCKDRFYERCNGKKTITASWTPYTTFRLLLDMFPELNGVILYLDIDTLVCGNISKVFSMPMQNYELCVTRDVGVFGERMDGKYFNAGVLLINIDMVRKTLLFKRGFKYLIDIRPEFCDQDVLNLLAAKIKYRSNDDFNRIELSRKPTTIIKHFAGPCYKPWKRNFIKVANKYNYDVWLSDIEEWKKMKSKI